LDRNFVAAFNGLGWCRLYAGLLDEVIPLAQQAIRLSPRDPGIGGQYYLIGTVHQLQSRNDEAIAWYEKARSAWPASPEVRSRLASAYAPQWRDRTRRRRTRRSPQAEQRRSF
jgi:tetratricopeptide (TPR) repeat protein